MTGTVDNILAAFEKFCKTGEVTTLSETDFGYIEHAMGKAARNAMSMGEQPSLARHQLFMLMALSGDPEKIGSFLIAAAKRRGQ